MYRRYDRRDAGSSGFTLIELLIAIALISILLGAIWTIYSTGLTVFYSQSSRSNIKAQTGRALGNISEKIRKADSVTSAQARSLTVTGDFNDDGAIETERYVWSGTAGQPLNMVTGSSTVPLVDSVAGVSFAYYAANNVVLAAPAAASQVRSVGMSVTAQDGDEIFSLRTQATLRSL